MPCNAGWLRTVGGSLLAVAARPVGIEDAHHLVKAAVELVTVGGEAERVGGRQLIQVVVWPEGRTEVAVEGVPNVHRVVTTTAGNAERDWGWGVQLMTGKI